MTAPAVTLQHKAGMLTAALRSELVERDDQIEAMLVAFFGGLNFFSLGTPGVGKSMANDRLVAYIEGVKVFHKLLTRGDTLPDLFGMLNLPLLDQGVYEYQTDGFLPWCDIARLGEIFKTSTTVLNSLLEATNERTFTNGATFMRIPLSSVFCDSNEMPPEDSDELAAIWDRLDIRVKVDDTSDEGLRHLLDMDDPDPSPAPIFTWDEVVRAKAEVAAIPLTEDAKDALIQIRRDLRAASITPSPRRLKNCRRAIRAFAWLEGADKADVEHLVPVVNMLWERPEQIKQVEQIVLGVCSPNMGEALKVADAVGDLAEQAAEVLKETDKTAKSAALMDLAGKLKVESAKVNALSKTSVGRALRLVEATQRQIDAIKKRASDEIGF